MVSIGSANTAKGSDRANEAAQNWRLASLMNLGGKKNNKSNINKSNPVTNKVSINSYSLDWE